MRCCDFWRCGKRNTTERLMKVSRGKTGFQTFIKFENNKDEKLKMRKYSKFMPSYVHQGMVKK